MAKPIPKAVIRPINVELPQDLADQLHQLAARNSRTMTAEVVLAIISHLIANKVVPVPVDIDEADTDAQSREDVISIRVNMTEAEAKAQSQEQVIYIPVNMSEAEAKARNPVILKEIKVIKQLAETPAKKRKGKRK